MSYILDALRKADRERDLARVPTLTTVHIPIFVRERRIALWIIAGVLVIGSPLLWLLRPTLPRAPLPAADSRPVAAAPPPPAAPAEPVRPAVPPQAISAPPPAPAESPRPGRIGEPRQNAQRPPDREAARSTRPARPPADQPSRSIRDLLDAIQIAPRPAETGPTAPPPRPAPQPSVEAGPAQAGPLAPPPAVASQPTLREAMAKMGLDVFVYTDVESERMAVINGRRYLKGQLVDGRYLIEDITPEGVLLSFQGERSLLRP